ncbi:MAG: T9SS type A sorting domain-containing protein [Bacteroidia bacterium]
MRQLVFILFLSQFALAQFAPPAGQIGSTAISKDSSVFVNWANYCVLQRGLQDVSNTSGPYATIGDSSSPLGIADNSVLSLGDGGNAVLTFPQPIMNGPGNDFAVFENSFSDDYLEFGFVEVSSDGINFFRFPATCNIQDTVQTGSFGLSDATKVNNLAGKYRALFGTPFDLSELQGISGLDVNNIIHVKIIDVVGSVSAAYATYDKNNNKINDPWPTQFASSGFDLDAVGVINQAPNSVAENNFEKSVSFYPNPCKGMLNYECGISNAELYIMDICGNEFSKAKLANGHSRIDLGDLPAGVYFLKVTSENRSCIKKIIIAQ